METENKDPARGKNSKSKMTYEFVVMGRPLGHRTSKQAAPKLGPAALAHVENPLSLPTLIIPWTAARTRTRTYLAVRT